MKKLHSWNLSYSRAREVQAELSGKVQFTPLKKSPKLVAGIDCAFSKDGERIIAAVVLLRLPQFELVEMVSASRKVTFPYIPGLLSFREAPVCIAAVEKRIPAGSAWLPTSACSWISLQSAVQKAG
jgi:deoxyribonuclease V